MILPFELIVTPAREPNGKAIEGWHDYSIRVGDMYQSIRCNDRMMIEPLYVKDMSLRLLKHTVRFIEENGAIHPGANSSQRRGSLTR